MRLAYLTTDYGRASDTFIRNEVTELRARGHHVSTFSVRRPGDEHLIDDDIRRERAQTEYLLPDHVWAIVATACCAVLLTPRIAVRSGRLAVRARATGFGGWLRALLYWMDGLYLGRRLRALGIMHLHVHMGRGAASIGMLGAASAGIPFSLTIHGPGDFLAASQWALGVHIAASAFTACVSYYGMSQCMLFSPTTAWDRIVLVRAAPRREFFAAAPTPPLGNRRLVWVGRFASEKGVDVLLQAFAALLRLDPARDAELVMIGDGEQRAAVERQIAGLELAQRVRMRGWLAPDQVRAELQAARCLVVSSFAEGLPTVLMEALAMGRPVIATWIAGVPELVDEGRSGWLVPPGSVDALAAAMDIALSVPTEQLAMMGNFGAARVREQHDIGNEVAKLEALFRRSQG
jgi:glycosyltransferase involved in cell wall biosynthesis